MISRNKSIKETSLLVNEYYKNTFEKTFNTKKSLLTKSKHHNRKQSKSKNPLRKRTKKRTKTQ